MMVTFISECEKKALKRTRKVLDAFADRIGQNTWQTVITQEGLSAVKKQLRKTASKNTAVSCHWLRSRARSQLLWIVGNQRKFNFSGMTPVNTTTKNLLHTEWENNWEYASTIQIVAVLAALLHDIGKSTIGFQNKLKAKKSSHKADPYRHEWISFRIFQAMVDGCETDQAWLERLMNFQQYQKDNRNWLEYFLKKDALEKQQLTHLDHLPPLAQWVCWLILSHHRMPFYEGNYVKNQTRLRDDKLYLTSTVEEFYKNLKPVVGWVKSYYYCDNEQDFWNFDHIITKSQNWQKSITRWARKALNHQPLMALSQSTIHDPFIMHLSRMSLMIGDHNYSSLPFDDTKRVYGDKVFIGQLSANTDPKTGELKQSLDEHLIGVGKMTAQAARIIPQLSEELPTIVRHRPFERNTSIQRFSWQNKAYDLACQVHDKTKSTGFFGVNMASTGCGKTLGNARIMYGLSDKSKGARFTIALGLRILTLQTGQALSAKLNLDSDALATLIGGQANRKLFELNQNQSNTGDNTLDTIGSESLETLVTEQVDVTETSVDEKVLGTVLADPKASDLLYTPIVSCTVDHMISASENTRGGKHIVPMLRLLTSDLVLDEPDDFDQNDLPALSRLVHFAGMLGSRVLLSSATLTPDIVTGLFNAYQAGRSIWNKNTKITAQRVTCAWFDEYKQVSQECYSSENFSQYHNQFTQKRANKLSKNPSRRIAEVLSLPLPPAPENQKVDYSSLAEMILNASYNLHSQHHETCPDTQKKASIGLVRIANINSLIPLAQAMQQTNLDDYDCQIHLCCYHARQLLLLRNTLETKLDNILTRDKESNLFQHVEITNAMGVSSSKHHIFIVLATPVAEVGRDHDYDWAIVEPSSMRSIIQLAGRIWRHRPDKIAQSANLYIMESNIKAFSHGDNLGVSHPVFQRPGFESKPNFLLETHNIKNLISDKPQVIDSILRIKKPKLLSITQKLADLEHGVMADLLDHPKINYVNAFFKQENNGNRLCAHLQQASPFRWQEGQQTSYVYVPDEDSSTGFSFKYSEEAWNDPINASTLNQMIQYQAIDNSNNRNVQPWLYTSFERALNQLAEQLNINNRMAVALKYATVDLSDRQEIWSFHPWLGFW